MRLHINTSCMGASYFMHALLVQLVRLEYAAHLVSQAASSRANIVVPLAKRLYEWPIISILLRNLARECHPHLVYSLRSRGYCVYDISSARGHFLVVICEVNC